MTIRSLSPFFLCVSLSTGAFADFEIVREGQSQCLIVTAGEPGEAAKSGSVLLANMVKRISGVEPLVVGESQLENGKVTDGLVSGSYRSFSPSTFLLVGESGLAEKLGVSGSGLGPGAIRMKTSENALVLLGADAAEPTDPNGSRYAVVTFLEEVLGVRYLWPGELGLVVPEQATIRVPDLDRTFAPMIGQRKMRWSRRNDRIDIGIAYLGFQPEDHDRLVSEALGKESGVPDWSEWQRLGGTLELSGGHSYGYTWEKYHLEHPEWFALQGNGSRDQSALNPDRARLCKSRLELIEALARDKIAELEKSGAKSISLSPNDGGRAGFCLCDECRKLDPREGRPVTLTDYTSSPPREFEYVSLTDRMVWFWNRLAERISEERPGTWFGAYAYSVYKAPPLREKLHPNIAVSFVGVSYENEEVRQHARADWKAWSGMTGKLLWRPNLLLYGRREGVPAVYLHKLAEDTRHFAHHSLLGTDFDSIVHHWATEGLNYYALSRLLWDPDQSADAILEDYCRAGFGAAAETMKKYFLAIEELTNRTASTALPKLAVYTPETSANLRERLEEAITAAGGDERVRRRITFLRDGLDFAEVQARTHAFYDRHKDTKPTAEELADFRADMETKFRMMRRLFREQPLALNMAMIAWGSEGVFRRFGWNGAKTLPGDRWDADEDGRVVPPQ